MTKLLRFRSLTARITAIIAVSMLVLASGLTILAAVEARFHEQAVIETANRDKIRLIAAQLQGYNSAIDLHVVPEPGASYVTWPNMPVNFAADFLDHAVLSDTEVVTLFRYDAEQGGLVRRSTNVVAENGERAVGTLLEGPAHDTLMQGASITAILPVGSATWDATYVPILDETGAIVGALASGRDITGLWGTVLSFLGMEIFLSVVLTVVVTGLAALVVRRSMAPLGNATETITALANGDLGAGFDAGSRRDEIASLGTAIGALRTSMQEAKRLAEAEEAQQAEAVRKHQEQRLVVDALSEALERLAELDLSQDLTDAGGEAFPEDYIALRDSCNDLTRRLTRAISTIRDAAAEVKNNADEFDRASEDLARRTESQASTLEETAAALEEMGKGIEATADNAAEAERFTSESHSAARQTGKIVEDAIAAMDKIEQASARISEIVSTIEQIAFQTNLLALNAGVEAARAGDAGRGFSVVASEVRSLAQHSAEAAQKIKDLIEDSSRLVGDGGVLVRNTGDALGGIIERVAKVSDIMTRIADAAKEQALGVSEINTGMRDLDQATQQNAAMAEEVTAASKGLSSAAARMGGEVSRFRLAGANAPVTPVAPARTGTDESASAAPPAKPSPRSEVAAFEEVLQAPDPSPGPSRPAARPVRSAPVTKAPAPIASPADDKNLFNGF